MKKMLGLVLFGLSASGGLQAGLGDFVQFQNNIDQLIVVSVSPDNQNFEEIRLNAGESSPVMRISQIKVANARYGGYKGGKLGIGKTSLYDNPLDVNQLRNNDGSFIVTMNPVPNSLLPGNSFSIKFNYVRNDDLSGAYAGDESTDVVPLPLAWELLGAQGKTYADKAWNYVGLGRQPTAYEILGVSESASKSDILKAYKTLAQQWHPDKKHNQGRPQVATQMFKIIASARDEALDNLKK